MKKLLKDEQEKYGFDKGKYKTLEEIEQNLQGQKNIIKMISKNQGNNIYLEYAHGKNYIKKFAKGVKNYFILIYLMTQTNNRQFSGLIANIIQKYRTKMCYPTYTKYLKNLKINITFEKIKLK